MKLHQRILAAAAVITVGVIGMAQAQAAALNQPAPAFTGVLASGDTVSLEQYRGKTLVLEWTNHDCPFVKKHYDSGNMQAQQREAAEQGVVWLQVVSSAVGKQGYVDAQQAQKLNADRNAAPAGVLLDPQGTIGKAYEARTTPHMYIIDANGTLVYKGGIDSISSNKKEDIAKAEQYVRLALADLANNRPVAQSNTRPYGCSVKYAN